MKSLWLMLTQRRCFSPAWVFTLINIMVRTWILYLPYIKKLFMLNEAEVGSAFFCRLWIILFYSASSKNQKSLWGGALHSNRYSAFIFNFPLIVQSYYTFC